MKIYDGQSYWWALVVHNCTMSAKAGPPKVPDPNPDRIWLIFRGMPPRDAEVWFRPHSCWSGSGSQLGRILRTTFYHQFV